jgi:hypothetical protein
MSSCNVSTLLKAYHKATAAEHAADCRGGGFVSLLAGEAHVPAALCLRSMMRRARSKCPHTLVYNDPLSSRSVDSLADAYGTDRLVSTSSLQARVERWAFECHLNASFKGRYMYSAVEPYLLSNMNVQAKASIKCSSRILHFSE